MTEVKHSLAEHPAAIFYRPNERNLRNVIWDKQELSRQRRVVLLTIPQIGTDHAFPGTFSVFTGVSPCDPGPHLRMPAALCSDKRKEHYYESAKSWPNPFERTELSAGPSRCSCLLIGPALLRPPNLSVNRRNTRAVPLPCAQRTLSRRLRRRVCYPIGAWVPWSKCKRDGISPLFPENANE
jgi:hypothetical protein